MNRRGSRPGADSTTVLLLDRLSGTPRDLSLYEQVITVENTSGELPQPGLGYFGDGVRLGNIGVSPENGLPRIKIAQAASLDLGTLLTFETAYYRANTADATYYIASRKDGSNNLSWEVKHANFAITFAIENPSGTGDTLSISVPIGQNLTTLARWYYVRFVADLNNGWLYGFLNGNLRAKKSTALVALRTASLGPLYIGANARLSSSLDYSFGGHISNVKLRNVADFDETTLPQNILLSDHITTKQTRALEYDLGEIVESNTWVDDTAGGFYTSAASLGLINFLVDDTDLAGFTLTTSGGVTTTLTKVGNITDVDSTANTYCYDAASNRIYANPNPSTYATALLRVTYRCADHTLAIAGRNYRGTLVVSDAGHLATNYIFAPLPLSSGGRIAISRQHPDHPASFGGESSSKIVWPGAPVRLYKIFDHGSWSEKIPIFTGYVETSPADDRDVIAVNIGPRHMKLDKVVVEPHTINVTDYPYAPKEAIGYKFPTIWGVGHLRVPAPCVDVTPTVISGVTCYKRKISARAITSITQLGSGNSALLYFTNVDLSVGTLYSSEAPTTELWANVSGYGTPSSATSAAGIFIKSFSTPTEAITDPMTWLKTWLSLLIDLPSSAMSDSTWANTATRVLLGRRFCEVMDGLGSGAAELQRFFQETVTFLRPYVDGTYGWSDVDKTTVSSGVLRDCNIISDLWYNDIDKLSRRADGECYEYQLRSDGTTSSSAPFSLSPLKSDVRYLLNPGWNPPGGKTRFMSTGSANNWLQNMVRRFLEEVGQLRDITVSPKYASIKVLDVLTDYTSNSQAGNGARLRVFSREETPEGNLKLIVVPETLFPANGAQPYDIRDSYGPQRHFSFGKSSGQSVSSAGVWSVVGDYTKLFQGSVCRFPPSGVSHRLAIRAQRIGGSNDTDLAFRLRTASGHTIASIAGVTTAAQFVSTTSFTNIPTIDELIWLEVQTNYGATGTVWSASWESEETAASPGDPISGTTLWEASLGVAGATLGTTNRVGLKPTHHFSYGNSAGTALAATAGAWATVDNCERLWQGGFGTFPVGTSHRLQVYASGSAGTTQFRIYDFTNSQVVMGPVTGVGGLALYQSTTAGTIPESNARLRLQYLTVGAETAVIYSAGWEAKEAATPASEPVVPEVIYSDGNSAGVACATTGSKTVWKNVPLRAGQVVINRAYHETLGVTYQAALYCDPGAATDFAVRLRMRWYFGGTTFDQTMDFGTLTTAGLYIAGLYLGSGTSQAQMAMNDLQVTVEYSSTANTATVYSASLAALYTYDVTAEKYLTVPGRAGAFITTPMPVGARHRWAIRANGTGCSGFRPVIVSTDGPVVASDTLKVIADFGVITTDGVFVTEGLDNLAGLGVELRYSNGSGSPVVYAASLEALYPEE